MLIMNTGSKKRGNPKKSYRFQVAFVFCEFGVPDWVRTSDLQLRKLTLFQLSYGYVKPEEYPNLQDLAKKSSGCLKIR
jgi:hypothetical protein